MKKVSIVLLIVFVVLLFQQNMHAQTSLGSLKYDDFKTPQYCGSSCHTDFYQQWKQAMMSQAYTHEWDEIEYFKLAVPHAEKDKKVEEVKAGCNGCHAPMSFAAGDVPPPLPSKNSRANESVSCDVCHSISGYTGEVPYNFNYVLAPGRTKFATRKGEITSPAHDIEVKDFMKTGDFCGICHNEKDPYGIWVSQLTSSGKKVRMQKRGFNVKIAT